MSVAPEHATAPDIFVVFVGLPLDISKSFSYSLVDGPLVSPSATAPEASGVAVAPYKADVLALFQQLLPAEFFLAALKQAKVRENNRVYTSAVVVWLMICQRLQVQRQGTLEGAVLELLGGLPSSFWPQPCKRLEQAVQEGGPRMSNETGAYNKARQELSLPVVEQCCDHAFQQLIGQSVWAPDRRPAFFFDGTIVRMPHDEELVAAYPPTANQHGVSHWPSLRLLVAHDLFTGLAMRPQWGPVNGRQAVSEQGLLEEAIDRLPSQATVVGDANFGVFSVAYTAAQRGHPVVLRLTTVRARHLAGGHLQDGTDRRIQWRPTREDRRSHPQLPTDAVVAGRLIVRRVQPSNGAAPFLLALFTTLEDPVEQVVELYGKRWNIEVDLRHLKSTLRLEDLEHGHGGQGNRCGDARVQLGTCRNLSDRAESRAGAAGLQFHEGEECAPGVSPADRGRSGRGHRAEIVRRHAVLPEPMPTSPTQAVLLSPRRVVQAQGLPGAPRLSSCHESICSPHR